MNLFKKTVGFVAGSALALSLATGAMAETDPSSATLANDAAGNCFVELSGGTFPFGTWVWDGASYVVPSGLNGSNIAEVTVNVTQTVSSQPTICNVSADAGALSDSVLPTPNQIPAGNTVENVNSTNSNTAAVSTNKGAGANVPVEVTLADNTNIDTLPPGTYNGIVTITALKAA